jgi:phosphatidylglycerol:prolipoprotein diacylglycerol transferase
MYPELFRIGSFPIQSFGVLLMIAVLFAFWLMQKRSPAFGIPPEKVVDGVFWAVIPGILGARLAYILLNWSDFASGAQQLWTLRFEGLTSFGGLILGAAGLMYWAKRNGIKTWAVADAASVPLLAAHAIGRIGCLLNGCCFGLPTEGPLGVKAGLLAGRFLPAQGIDTIQVLLLAVVIVLLERSKKLVSGQSLALMAVAYGLSRFIYEFFRAYEIDEHGHWHNGAIESIGLTLGQLASLALILIGIWLFMWRKKAAAPTA